MLRPIEEVIEEIQTKAEALTKAEAPWAAEEEREQKPPAEFDPVQDLSDTLNMLIKLYKAAEMFLTSPKYESWRRQMEFAEVIEETKEFLNQWAWQEPEEANINIVKGETK